MNEPTSNPRPHRARAKRALSLARAKKDSGKTLGTKHVVLSPSGNRMPYLLHRILATLPFSRAFSVDSAGFGTSSYDRYVASKHVRCLRRPPTKNQNRLGHDLLAQPLDGAGLAERPHAKKRAPDRDIVLLALLKAWERSPAHHRAIAVARPDRSETGGNQ